MDRDRDRAHLAMEAWIVTIMAVLAAVGTSAMAPAAPPRGRLLKVPKVYNALITSDIPLLPSRAETAATAALGPVFLYSTHLPVVLQPQAQGSTPQNHLDKLSQLQNQLQREEVDQQRQVQLRYQQQLLPERQPVPQHLLERQPLQQQLFPERQLPVQQPYPVKQSPVQQQLFAERQLPEPPYPAKQLPVQHQLFPERQLPEPPYPAKQQPVQQQLFPERQLPEQPYPVKQLPVQHQLFHERLPVPQRQLPVQQQLLPERQSPVRQQLFPERQQPGSNHHPSLQVQQVPVQHLSSEQLSHQHWNAPYQQKAAPPILQQQYPQIDPQLQQKQLQLQHQKQLQLQVQQQKQLQLNQFVDPKVEQDTSYLPMPEMNVYQPPPSVHIDEIKNNKPSNSAIPDVPPPPLPVGKRLQSYSYNSPGLSPPPPTNQHVPYG